MHDYIPSLKKMRVFCTGKGRSLEVLCFESSVPYSCKLLPGNFHQFHHPFSSVKFYPIHFYIQDVALVSLANVLYRSGFDKDATAVIHMSLEVCQRTAKCEVNSSPQRYSSLFRPFKGALLLLTVYSSQHVKQPPYIIITSSCRKLWLDFLIWRFGEIGQDSQIKNSPI